MVEFTKDEFVYIFDGLFDNGGNSNMLRLYDDIPLMDINILPKDSLTMYDVSKADVHVNMKDEENIGFIKSTDISLMKEKKSGSTQTMKRISL